MPGEIVRREPIWSGRLRVLHWTLALTTLVLLATGWVLSADYTPLMANLRRLHIGAGILLSLALTARLVLLVWGRGAEHARDFRMALRGVSDMLRFYITAGRAPVPAYYAHNPLWAPLYLLLFAVLTLQVASGLAWSYAGETDPEYYLALPWLLGRTLPEWHHAGYRVISVYTLTHIIAVGWHDWKGTGSEISAMLNGHKIFIIRKASDVLPVAWKKAPGPTHTGNE